MADGRIANDSYSNFAEGVTTAPYRQNRRGELVMPNFFMQLAADGRLFCSSDADENDVSAASATSYAATTPTFLLQVPAGKSVLPLWVSLTQSGTVAGEIVNVILSYDSVERYSTGGVSEAVTPMHTGAPVASSCRVYSGATATAATAARTLASRIAVEQVAAPVPGDSPNELLAGRDFVAPFLVGPAAFLVFTYAGTTGAQWIWSIGWAEFDTADAD